ncbi:MAG: hypothetical protein JSU94_15395 [Phycisphaerales bacterium]|nr:MAG: hypothetical protein JSU94_15395 [Phycisphaerales bacterium]
MSKTKMHKQGKTTKRRKSRGAALLVVLFIVMFLTVLSIGFVSRSDTELTCGQNMEFRAELDYLAESGLEHARGLILRPQDLSTEYWTGADGQQIVTGDDYYDVQVVRDDSDPNNRCNYFIDCNSYRLENSQKIALSGLTAELRLDPCIAYWIGSSTTVSGQSTINGDVYCVGDLVNSGTIRGDVFAGGLVSGSGITGSSNGSVSQAPVVWPAVAVASFYPTYYIGAAGYAAEVVAGPDHPSGSFGPSGGNPAGLRYAAGLGLRGNVNIDGTLVVSGDLEVTGSNNVVSSGKNFPALVVDGDVKIYSGSLQVNGLAVVTGEVRIAAGGATLDVVGGLLVGNRVTELAVDASGREVHAALYNGPTWRPAGGAQAGALEFDGVDDYLRTDDSASELQLTGDYTLSFWVKADAAQEAWAGLLSKCDPAGNVNHWSVVFDSSGSRKVTVYHQYDPPATESWDTGLVLSDLTGGWRHVAIVRSGTTMKSYLDGFPRNTGTWDNNPGSGDGHLKIGSDCTGSPSYVYKGLMDDIRVYGRALDANDVYPPAGGLPDLIGNWKLDESGGEITITAAPCRTAVMVWSSGTVVERWEQAAGAFFKSIKRK